MHRRRKIAEVCHVNPSLRQSLFARKSIESLHQEGAEASGLRRTLTAKDLAFLGIGCIMGTGIFVLTGQAAAHNAGPAVALSFALAGLAATLGALCYAEMASMIPVAGSAYTYAYATLGECVAFVVGWDLLLEWLVGAAAVSVGWSAYFCAFVENLTGWQIPSAWRQAPVAYDAAAHGFMATHAYVNLPAACIVLAVTGCLLLGIQQSAAINRVIVLVKVAIVLLFLGVATRHINPTLWRPFVPANLGTFGKFGASGVLQATTLVFFAYLGFDAVSVAAQETRRPERDVPLGILWSLGVCTLLYMAMALTLTGIVPYTELGVAHPVVVALRVMGMPMLEGVIEVGALAGLTSVVLVQLYAQSRILYTMARDGFLPRGLTQLHPRWRTPHRITGMVGVLCAVAAAALPIDVLAEMTSIGTLLAFALVAVGVMVLRVTRPDLPRRFRVPGGAFLLPGASVLICVLLMLASTPATLVRLFVWMGLGMGVYGVHKWRALRGAPV